MRFLNAKKFLILFILIVFISYIFVKSGFSIKTPLNYKTNSNKISYIALIIDDFGNNGDGTEAMMHLGIPITAAVMPFLPHSKSDAEKLHNADLEIIMHVPMEPVKGDPSWLGPKGITCNLSEKEIENCINEGLKQIKWAVGMNNHMGSKAMKDRRIVNIIFKIAQQNNLYFVDSKTCENSVAPNTAKDLNVTFFTRDVFLDNSKEKTKIEKQLIKLADIAEKKGYAIGIGHVGPAGGTVTAQAIKSMYPILEKKGIRFVSVSELNKVINNKKNIIQKKR